MRTPIEGDVSIEVVPLVEDHDVARNLEELVGIVADRQVRTRERRRQALDTGVKVLQHVLVGHDLAALLGRPWLEGDLSTRWIDDHRGRETRRTRGCVWVWLKESGKRCSLTQTSRLRWRPRIVGWCLHGLGGTREPVAPQIWVAPCCPRRRGRSFLRHTAGRDKQRQRREGDKHADGTPTPQTHLGPPSNAVSACNVKSTQS